MAMTKKERAEFDALILKAETLAALRWTNPVSRDVPPPIGGGVYSEGWDFNVSGKNVWQAWSAQTCHGRGLAPKGNERYNSASQNCCHLFSTEAMAFSAMRREIEDRAAADLLGIDKKIISLSIK